MTRISPSITRALASSLRDADYLKRDAAGVALARRYAAVLESVAEVADALADLQPESETQREQITRLAAQVDVIRVTADVGPKLLAALTALGMTPAARAASSKGGTPDVGTPAGTALAALRSVHGPAR